MSSTLMNNNPGGPGGSSLGGGMGNQGMGSLNMRIYDRDKEEALLCPGGRLLSLNVSGSDRNSEFARVLVPYPAAGNWFVTILPTCARLFTYRRPQDQQDM